jgi:hypothetical protein
VLRLKSAESEGEHWCGFLNILASRGFGLSASSCSTELLRITCSIMDQTVVLLLTFSALLMCSLRIGLASRHYISRFPFPTSRLRPFCHVAEFCRTVAMVVT